MKIKINLVILCFVFCSNLSFAQEINEFFFEQAQPKRVDAFGKFPLSLRGLYKSEKDSTRRLRITSDSLLIEVPMAMFASPSELAQKNYTLQDTVIITDKGKVLPCLVKNDTVLFIDYVHSPIYFNSKNNLIKKNENTYVLNKQLENGFYTCLLLIDDGNKITIAQFDMDKKEAELSKNKKIEKNTKTTTPYYLANLKWKDFSKLIESGYFPNKQVFYKRYSGS